MITVRWNNVRGECVELQYLACESSARRFAHSFNTSHCGDIVTVSERIAPSCVRRLPCERQWLGP